MVPFPVRCAGTIARIKPVKSGIIGQRLTLIAKGRKKSMSEGKQQSWLVPLRTGFHATLEPVVDERKMGQAVVLPFPRSSEEEPTAPSLPTIKSSMLRQSQQIKELIYLGNVLRAELGLDEVLDQVISSISTCTGFRISVIKLIDDGYEYLRTVARDRKSVV